MRKLNLRLARAQQQCKILPHISPGQRLEQGIKMRAMSVVKVVLLAGAVAAMSLSGASAKGMKQLPPGACAFEKVAIANNSFCSFACDPATNWCSQQLCANGTLTKVVPCYGSFCTQKCGG
jgi:hypothetical protein